MLTTALRCAQAWVYTTLTLHRRVSPFSLSHACSEVVELRSDNFDANVGNGEDWLVEFFAPWCGHCTKLKPLYAQAAKKAAGMFTDACLRCNCDCSRPCSPLSSVPNVVSTSTVASAGKVNFASVDGTKSRALAMRFGINGYPTMFFVTNKTEVRKVNVAHTTEAITQFALKGWKVAKEVPVGGFTSPMGAWGQIKFNTMFYIEKVTSLHEPIAEKLGVPGPVILFVFMFLVTMGLAGGLIACAVAMGPKKKRGAATAAARPHAE